jgi:hypothetical protein
MNDAGTMGGGKCVSELDGNLERLGLAHLCTTR